MNRLTVKDIIKRYLLESLGNEKEMITSSVVIEKAIVLYAIDRYKTYHLPTTFSREFRRIRERKLFNDLEITEIEPGFKDSSSKVKYFKIRKV